MTFQARSEDVKLWLLRYHALRAHEIARGERTEECPALPVLINDTQVNTTLVEPFANDESLIVFVRWGNYNYLGAILAPTSNDTWAACRPPKRIEEGSIGLRNLDVQVALLQLLAQQ
jgi:hypothetical protein